jgi:hypothetical protein
MQTPRHRSHRRFRLDVTAAKTVPIVEDRQLLPWPVAAIGGGIVAALAGVLLISGVVLIGWLTAISLPVPAVLAFAGQVWLLAHGGVLLADGVRITLIPLGLTLALVGLAASISSFALRQANLAQVDQVEPRQLARRVVLTAGQFALGYSLTALVVATAAGVPLTPALPGVLTVSIGSGLLGAGWQAGYRWVGPSWLRAGVRGGLAGIFALVLVSSLVLVAALVQGEARMAALEKALGLDAGGVVVWGAVMLLYLPDLLAWVAAWVLGAGFTLGDGSLVAPWVTQLGLLPAVPVFGALPAEGTGGLQAWLLLGVLVALFAGGVAARWHRGDPSRAIGAGAVAGVVTAAVFLAWALVSRGALGVVRFAQVGPRWPEVLIGVGILVLGAALGAIATWLIDKRLPSAD